MTTTVSYSYCVIRYVHDAGAGERLNVGVVLYSPSVPFLGFLFETHFERLSRTFSNFNGDQYKEVLRHFEAGLNAEKERIENSLALGTLPADVLTIIRQLWPDQGLAFQAGELRAGISSNLQHAVQDAFSRFVASQGCPDSTDTRRDNDDVWNVFSAAFAKYDITGHLGPKDLQQDGLTYRFDHALKNGKWHIFEPLSLDYKKLSSLRRRVSEVIGDAFSVRENPEVGAFYVLLGKPQNSSFLDAYQSAKVHLRKTLQNSDAVIDEDEAEAFAKRIAQVVEGHAES